MWDRLAELPAYDEDLDVALAPEPVRALREAIAGADAVLIATPEYNASLPGALKNALEQELPVGQTDEAFDADGRLRDPAARAALAELAGALAERARRSAPAQLAEAA